MMPEISVARRNRSHRRFLRLGLRTFLILLTLVALLFGAFVNRAQQQRAAVSHLRKLGAQVHYNPKSNTPAWLRELMGDDYFVDVWVVNLAGKTVNDTIADDLKHFPCLLSLNLMECKITDQTAAILGRMPHLESLWLNGTAITDNGLAYLSGHHNLKALSLYSTQIGSESLLHLRALSQLQSLTLANTGVGDEGLKHLRGLTSLRVLDVTGTAVTDDAIAELQQVLPKLSVIDSQNRVISPGTPSASSMPTRSDGRSTLSIYKRSQQPSTSSDNPAAPERS